jgi:hypothetical protein
MVPTRFLDIVVYARARNAGCWPSARAPRSVFSFRAPYAQSTRGGRVRQLADPATSPARTPAFVRWSQTAAFAIIGAAVSLLISGLVAAEATGFFHLQILAGLWREPQFAEDPFVQSMQYYASGFWFPLTGRFEGEEVYQLLVTFNVLSRILFSLARSNARQSSGLRRRARD